MTKETVGKVSLDLMQGAKDALHTPQDQMEAQLQDYEKNVYEALARGKKDHAGTFYIVVLTKKERLMQNVIRNYFLTRESCPTPEWDQTVYQVRMPQEEIVFLWTIPARDICQQLKDEALDLDPVDRELLEFVMAFDDRRLDALAKRLNGELVQS